MVAQMIRTFVAEPTTLTREGLVAILAREEDIEVIAAVERAEEVVPAACELKPDDQPSERRQRASPPRRSLKIFA
jgi:hypothetical protein